MPIQFDKQGREIVDPTPAAFSADVERPESLESMMRRMIRQHLSAYAVEEGDESFEEANDFEVEDEDWDDVETKYEVMGREPVDTETDLSSDGDHGSAQPAGLRPGQPGSAEHSGGNEKSAVDSQPVRHQANPLPADAREAPVEPPAMRTAVR